MIQKRPRCSFAASSVVVGAIPVAPEMTREKHLKKKKISENASTLFRRQRQGKKNLRDGELNPGLPRDKR